MWIAPQQDGSVVALWRRSDDGAAPRVEAEHVSEERVRRRLKRQRGLKDAA
jgi:hypothetical protein